MQTFFFRVFSLCILAFWVPIMAEDSLDDLDLSQLSLEELLNVQVTVASKKSETVHDAPGIVTVITRQEIAGFAGENLGQVLNRVVGVSFLSPDIYVSQTVAFRGQEGTPYNNHTLILLNGRPVRDPISGGLNGAVWAMLPLDAVDQIEIIRGPGSVLYGSCAYAGVVNIITDKFGEAPIEGRMSVRAGSYDAFSEYGNLRFSKGRFKGNIGVSHYEDEGPEYAFTDYLGVTSKGQFDHKGTGLVGTFNYGDLSLNTYLAEFDPYSLAGSKAWNPPTRIVQKTTNFDLGYRHAFNDFFSLNVNSTYNKHQLGTVAGNWTNGESTLYETSALLHPNKRLNIVIGGSFESSEWAGGLVRQGSNDSTSIYAQADYGVTDRIKLIGGVQYNKISNTPSHTSPRVGVVAHFNEKWGGKLLYSEAFRRAYPIETSFAVAGFRGNPSLAPELIATTEAQVFYTGTKSQVNVTLFKSRLSDIITRQRFDDPQLNPPYYFQYGNYGEMDYEGIELEAKLSFSKKLLGTANASYQSNEKDGIDNAALHPNEMVKFGMLYNEESWSLGLFNTYVGAGHSPKLVNPRTNEVNHEADAFNLLSAKLRMNLAKLGPADVSMALEADNILDKEVYYTDYPSKGVNTLVPLYEGIVWAGSLNLRF